MTTNRDRLIAIGSALYGERWIRSAATAIGVDEKQVRRWVSGAYDTPQSAVDALRLEALQNIIAMLTAMAASIPQSASDREPE